MQMKKSYGLLIIALLVLPMLTFATPIRASTGAPKLGAIDASGQMWASNFSVTVKAGNTIVANVDALNPTDYAFAIIFTYNGTDLMTFSGGQFDLYISKNGYSNISADDKVYATGFYVADLLNVFGASSVTKSNALLKNGEGTFMLGTGSFIDMQYGTNVTAKVMTGPIPFDITSDYKFIKVFDGASTLVAVSAQIVNILPSFELTPLSGPACTSVTLNGVALPAGVLYNITYNDTGVVIGQITSGDDGKFTFSWAIKDLMMVGPGSEDVIVNIVNNATGAVIDSVAFTELYAYITGVYSFDSGWVYPTGNSTINYVEASIFDEITVEGSYFCVTCGTVSFTIDGIALGTAELNSDGNFTFTFAVPELSIGDHTLVIADCNKVFVMTVTVLPTLIAIPSSGPIGTVIEFQAYGFPANVEVALYWYGQNYCEDFAMEEPSTWYWIANATLGADGKFNVTVTYTVPHQYGGPHQVVAVPIEDYEGTVVEEGPGYFDYIADTTFTVTPTIWVVPDPVDMDGGTITVYGNGLDPTAAYYPDVSNNEFNPYIVYCNCTGDLKIELVAAGFQPGLQSIALYLWNPQAMNDGTGEYVPVAKDTFTVTTTYDPVFTALNASLTTISGSFATIQTSLGQMQVSLDSINAKLVAINDTSATIWTDLGTVTTSLASINTAVTSIQGTEATISTDLGTVKGKVTSMEGNIATIQTDLGTVKSNVATIKGFLPVDMTPVWIAVVLSLIAAIAAIYSIVVIRSKIAA